MKKDERSDINPFTGKKHFDIVDDDSFLEQSYKEYYNVINQSQLLDNTAEGQLLSRVAVKLINAVENYLSEIGRSDYTQNYYDWEFHLIATDQINAFCMPGGKIVMYSGMMSFANTEEEIAFILGHEMAHALLDHSRTRASVQNAKNAVTAASYLGSVGLALVGLGELANVTRVVTNVADIGSEFFLMKPFGRNHELEADRLGMLIIHWAGYDIRHIPAFWKRMNGVNANNYDFFSTHPSDDKRIAVMENLIVEIQNQRDFYQTPVIGEVSSQNTVKKQIEIKETPSQAPSDNSLGKKSNVKFCTNCGTESPVDAVFCFNCGNKFQDLSKCPNCGNEINRGDLFCTNCGTKL